MLGFGAQPGVTALSSVRWLWHGQGTSGQHKGQRTAPSDSDGSPALSGFGTSLPHKRGSLVCRRKLCAASAPGHCSLSLHGQRGHSIIPELPRCSPVPTAGAGGPCRDQPSPCCAQPWLLLTLSETAQRAPSWQRHGKELLCFWSSHLFASELEEEVICQGAFKHHSSRVLGPGGTVTSSARRSIPGPWLLPERPRGAWRFWKELGAAGKGRARAEILLLQTVLGFTSAPHPSGNTTQVTPSSISRVKSSCSVGILLSQSNSQTRGENIEQLLLSLPHLAVPGLCRSSSQADTTPSTAGRGRAAQDLFAVRFPRGSHNPGNSSSKRQDFNGPELF